MRPAAAPVRGLGVALGVALLTLLLSGWSAWQWPEWARGLVALVVGTAALAANRWGVPLGTAAPWVAGAVVVAAAQLSPAAADGASAILWMGLLGLVAIAALPLLSRPTRLEWTAVVTGAAVLGVSLGAGGLPGAPSQWPSALQWLLYPLVWMGLSRWLASVEAGQKRWALGPAAVVLLGVGYLGAATVAVAAYDVWAARRTAAAGAHDRAVAEFRQAADLGERFGLAWVQREARLGMALSLEAAGRMQEAGWALGISPSGSVTIAPDAWEGPTGAHLFKSVSCWTNLWLWEGTVAVELRARGRAARDEWPRLQVTLDDQVLGEVEVTSTKEALYTLRGQVRTGRHQLRVALVEGFWSSRGEHRWARLGPVTVRYAEGAQ